MSIPYGNSVVNLQGLLPLIPSNTVVQRCSVSVSDQLEEISSTVHPSVANVLAEFAAFFAPVDGLPPPGLSTTQFRLWPAQN